MNNINYFLKNEARAWRGRKLPLPAAAGGEKRGNLVEKLRRPCYNIKIRKRVFRRRDAAGKGSSPLPRPAPMLGRAYPAGPGTHPEPRGVFTGGAL